MPDFDIDAALMGEDFAFAGNEHRKVFWARRGGEWVPVASIAESMGTWVAMALFIGGGDVDVTEEMRVRARSLLGWERQRSWNDWLPVLKRYWEEHEADFGHRMNEVNWQYRP